MCVCGGGGQGAQSEHAFAARSTLMQFHSIGMHMAAVQFQGSSSQPLLMSVYLCVYLIAMYSLSMANSPVLPLDRGPQPKCTCKDETQHQT